jgi:putative flippase GtrA
LKIVIPAYQPDHRLLLLIKDIKANSDYDIILVNDGSENRCDPIFERAEEYGCIVLNHETNLGKGASLKTAFSYIMKCKDEDDIICADCDGKHSWRDIEKLAEAVLRNPFSIILGCRNFADDVPLKCIIGNRITRTVFFLITGQKMNDVQTGLRGFPSAALPWLMNVSGNRYEYEMNQLLEATKAGYDLLCIPTDTAYSDINKYTYFRPVRDSVRVYLQIIKFSISSIFSGMIDIILLLLLNRFSGSLLLSVVSARIISSLYNFIFNKNLVFKEKTGKNVRLIKKYYSLAVVILICNYFLIFLFKNTFGISLLISKLLTEVILLFFSYTIKHRLIY